MVAAIDRAYQGIASGTKKIGLISKQQTKILPACTSDSILIYHEIIS